MDTRLLLVSSPSLLPDSQPHIEAVKQLCATYEMVILMEHGDNRYHFDEWDLPENARLFTYTYEDREGALGELQECLEGFGVRLVSRHEGNLLPFILTGSVMHVPAQVKFDLLDKKRPLAIDSHWN